MIRPAELRLRSRLARIGRRVPVYLRRDGPPLVCAAAAGQTARIEALLDGGAPIDACNTHGQSALHVAARCGHVEAAALLLARGASHRLQDVRGRRPLDPANVDPETLHGIRQALRRTAILGDDPIALSFGPAGDPWLAQLRRDGIVRIPDLVSPELLAAMQAEFAGFVDAIERVRAEGGGEKRSYDDEEHFWTDDLAWISNNAFKHSPSLARLFCDPRLTALARSYYGRHAFITRGVAMRYLPLDERQNDMFGWHHDLEDRRLKALVLLTDLPAAGQVMSYVRGSHVLRHPYRMFFRNGVPLEACRRALGRLEIFETAGRAGDVFLFDSNGVHRGNRRPDAPTRDTFFVEYGIDASNIWGGDPPQSLVTALAAPDDAPFAELIAAEKKWERSQTRRHPSWIENLYAIDAWRV